MGRWNRATTAPGSSVAATSTASTPPTAGDGIVPTGDGPPSGSAGALVRRSPRLACAALAEPHLVAVRFQALAPKAALGRPSVAPWRQVDQPAGLLRAETEFGLRALRNSSSRGPSISLALPIVAAPFGGGPRSPLH